MAAKKTAPDAEAEAPIDRVAAKAAFHEGLRAFNLGKWDEAIAAFENSYKLSGDPALLFNVAQAQRQAGHGKEAVIAYKAYLRENPDTPHRELVEAKIRELEAAAVEAKPAAAKPSAQAQGEVWVNPFEPSTEPAASAAVPAEPAPAVSPEPAESAPAAAEPPAEPAPVPPALPLPVAAPPPVPEPALAKPGLVQNEGSPAPAAQADGPGERWWLWTGVGAVVAAGVVTAVILSARGAGRDTSCPAGVDGCLSVGR
ncbi:MAG: hypothetical protein JXP73_04110 [Deltaproteobacteria bacterium]|nr:hypothetical protein [Deltaproteobacteria bacterium]